MMRTELERCEGEVRKLELKLEQAMDDETRTRLQRLEASFASRKGAAIFSPGAGLGLSPVHEDSTCSILDASDLSFDNTQGSILGDDSRLR